MATLWFALVAIMLAAYVVFDGFDLGAGALHLLVAKTDAERKQVLATIGPVWDGNEVWLLAAGGTLYFAFPPLYASGFSGFYLPLMMVLWLLILRGISIEFRSHLDAPVWAPLWDVVFSVSSLLLAVFFGAALGNVVRGVPLDEHGRFFEPLWTDFQVGAQNGILDWYTVLIGVAAVLALSMHGALWLVLKTDGPVRNRSLALAGRIWWALSAATLVITVVTFRVQPLVPKSLGDRPWGLVFPVLALAGLAGMRFFLGTREVKAFLASCTYLVGMLTSVVFGVYPMVLPSSTNPEYSLTIYNAAAPVYGLRVGLVWWVIGMVLVTGYFVFTYRHFAGKVRQ